jgi:opacity protein-like surface antigen
MFKKGFIAVVLAIALLAAANVVLALDPIPKQSGFSGYIQPGAGYLSIKSNTVAKVLNFDLSDQRIDDLNDEPDSESTAIFTVPYKLAYTFAGTRTELFLGTEVGDLLSFDTAQQLGVKQEIGSLGVLQAGVLFSGIVRVWKDPYVTGEDRDDTSRQNVGGQLVWDKIFGSNLELEYSVRKVDIGSEKSGEFLGLSNSEQDRLDRNGTVHRTSIGYAFKFGRNSLTPQVAIFSEDLDGEAMANTGVDVQLTYLYDGDPITLVLNGYVGQADYDKSNPVFDKTRDDERYGASATVYYKNPWGWSLLGSEPMRFFVTGAYYAIDSNIDFYNQEAILGMGGIAFRWK